MLLALIALIPRLDYMSWQCPTRSLSRETRFFRKCIKDRMLYANVKAALVPSPLLPSRAPQHTRWFSALLFPLSFSLFQSSRSTVRLFPNACIFGVLIILEALRTKRALCPDGINTAVNQACCALFPVVKDLQENLFENECGDAVSLPFFLK